MWSSWSPSLKSLHALVWHVVQQAIDVANLSSDLWISIRLSKCSRTSVTDTYRIRSIEYIYIHIHVSYIYMYIYVCTMYHIYNIYIYTYILYIYVYIYTCIYIYVYMYIYVHTISMHAVSIAHLWTQTDELVGTPSWHPWDGKAGLLARSLPCRVGILLGTEFLRFVKLPGLNCEIDKILLCIMYIYIYIHIHIYIYIISCSTA